MQNAQPLVVASVKDFASAKGFTQIVPKVRKNVNGYPYLTFITAKNEAENIYFSKKAGEVLEAGQPISKEMLTGMSVAETHNEQGELRIKLISNSERVDITSLL